MNLKHCFTAAIASTIMLGAQAFAVDAPVKKADGVLAATNGMTLYVFDKDPAGSVMYEDPRGERLTLYLKTEAKTTDTAFRFADENGISVFYWVDGDFGYALSGTLEKPRLLEIAKVVYGRIKHLTVPMAACSYLHIFYAVHAVDSHCGNDQRPGASACVAEHPHQAFIKL